MNDKEIKMLKKAVASGNVVWNPDSKKAYPVTKIGFHVEEGDDSLCAIFPNGTYAALYNCDLSDFKRTEPIRME